MDNFPTKKTRNIFCMFFDETLISCQRINTSRGDSDFRETIIAETESGNKWVIKIADNDFTFPEKIKVWQRTVLEYLNLGYYCPKIFCDKTGGFPVVEYNEHKCVAYAEKYSLFASLEDINSYESNQDNPIYDSCKKDIWSMTAKVAAKYFDYTEYPSAYCLFETFCQSDKNEITIYYGCSEILRRNFIMKQPNTVYTATLYLRLSKDDGLMDKDSASIDTQRDMLTRYCNDSSIIIHDYYIDDGFTGLNTDRPGFKKMIEDVVPRNTDALGTWRELQRRNS